MSTPAMSNTYKDRAVEVLRASWHRPPRRWRCSHRACGSRRGGGLRARELGLLATTGQTLSDIAERCGYYDQSAFTRQFRRVVGVSPGAYRSQILRR